MAQDQLAEPIQTETPSAPIHPRRCTARAKHGPCKRWAIQGADVCPAHGGNAPQVRKAAAARLLQTRITQLFDKTYNTQPITNPLAAFETLSGKVVGWMNVLEAVVADLKRPGYRSELTGEQIHAEVQLFERALAQCTSTLGTHARLNIDTRLAAIQAAQVAMVTRAYERGLAVAGITGSRAIEAMRAMGAELRVLEGEAADTPERGIGATP